MEVRRLSEDVEGLVSILLDVFEEQRVVKETVFIGCDGCTSLAIVPLR
jgi:hypothetical protein